MNDMEERNATRLLLPGLAAALFASAMLLFWCQPMVGKMVLPLLGGASSVWTTCVLFFQAVLLVGYVYAHVLGRVRDVRRQILLHGIVLLLPFAFIPVRFEARPDEAVLESPPMWLLAQLVVAVGVPFFAVSATAPLLQSWLARTLHPSARDPYFLYSASNLGSLVGLLMYPFVVEPRLGAIAQSLAWMIGYLVFFVLIGLVGALVWKLGVNTAPAPAIEGKAGLSWNKRLYWLAAAFVPSALMLAVTNHITANLTSAPFLWVVPLAIYLGTFIAAFGRVHVSSARVAKLIPVALLAFFPLVTAGVVAPPGLNWILVGVHLILFAFGALLCHTALAESRPDPAYLTQYYFWLALAGVMGGAFTALLAPAIFPTVLEYPLLVAALAFFRPALKPVRRSDFAPALVLLVVSIGIWILFRRTNIDGDANVPALVHTAFIFACYKIRNHPQRFAMALAVLILGYSFALPHYIEGDNRLHVSRNFFGVKKVLDDSETRLRVLLHGDTTHGIEATDPARRGQPLSYYHPTGPVGDVMEMISARSGSQRLAVLGLGSGTMASYGGPEMRVTFYEIDPEMPDVAGRFLTYLGNCGGPCEVLLGDGRLQLARAADGAFDMLMLDAFSSDSIPAHLLSKEALELYLAKLAPGGILLFNVSNRFLDVKELVSAAVTDAGLVAFFRSDEAGELRAEGKTDADHLVAARTLVDLESIANRQSWSRVSRPANFRVWTDDYSNILGLMRWW
jgi:predicted membrane-bound spermidine synthase